MSRLTRLSFFRSIAIGFMLAICLAWRPLLAVGPVPWDFKPYGVKVWIVVDDPNRVDIPGLTHRLNEAFYKSPGPAWSAVVEQPPEATRAIIFRRFESLTYDKLAAKDYVLAMKRDHEFASSVRSIATAGDRLQQVPGEPSSIHALKAASEAIPNNNWNQFLDSLQFDDQGQLLIRGGDLDGGDVLIYFDQTFSARLKNAIDENVRWKELAARIELNDAGDLVLKDAPDQDITQGRVIDADIILQPIRSALAERQAWSEFVTQWRIDEEDNLELQLPGTSFFLPLPNRVFKDFYLKQVRDDGIKTPDGAVGLDLQQAFVNQQVLIDKLRDLIVVGNGWQAFGSRLIEETRGVLFLESEWMKEGDPEKKGELMDAMILPRGIALNIKPEAKIIDPKIPGSIDPILSAPDKVFLVKIQATTSPMQVAVRELDCPMRLMGPIVRDRAFSEIDLADVVAQATRKSFAPVVRLENVGQKSAVGRVRAGGLLMVKGSDGDYVLDETNPAAIMEGDFLQPVIRRVDSYNVPIMLEIVDFAFLRMSHLDGAKAEMDAFAGRVGTLQGRSDRRTTRVALKIRPFFDDTVVRLHSKGRPDKPLVGYDIYEKDLETKAFTLVGRSDWDGRIRLEPPPRASNSEADAAAADQSADGGQGGDAIESGESTYNPMRLLYVKNGRAVLARLPVIPGQSELEIADIPADDIRLRAEAYLKGVENAIVDLVAIRSLLAARIRIKLEKGDLKEANELFVALRDQPTYEVIAEDMDNQSKIIKSENRIQQVGIVNMFARTRKMLVEHISKRLIRELKEDIDAVEKGEPMPSKVAAAAAAEAAVAAAEGMPTAAEKGSAEETSEAKAASDPESAPAN